jgi:hypothetical protein
MSPICTRRRWFEIKAVEGRDDLAAAKPPAPARSHHTGTGRSTAALHKAALGHPRIRFFANTAGLRLCRSFETGRVDGTVVAFGGARSGSMSRAEWCLLPAGSVNAIS